MREYARSLGIAFQIADDLLDVTGDEETTGKTLGSDLVKQKLTLPLIRMLESTENGQRERIFEWLVRGDAEAQALIRQELLTSEALEQAHQRAAEFAREARVSLSRLQESPARRLLEDLTEFAIRRTF